jgi:hypothetical protein
MVSSQAQTFLDREAASWAAFDLEVERVPADRREQPGVVGDWSLKDVVWHCAHWARFADDGLATSTAGSFADPFDAHPDEHWDQVNAEVAATSSAMSWDEVRAGAESARAALRATVAAGPSAEAIDWAAEESFVHYDEHAREIKAFADQA